MSEATSSEELMDAITDEIKEKISYLDRLVQIPVSVEVLETFTEGEKIKEVTMYRDYNKLNANEKEMYDKYADQICKMDCRWILTLISGAAWHTERGWLLTYVDECVLEVTLFNGDYHHFKLQEDSKGGFDLVSVASDYMTDECVWFGYEVAYAEGTYETVNELFEKSLERIKAKEKQNVTNSEPGYLSS